MEMINVNNYEAWLLDLSEGRLSASEIVELRAFAVYHPELEINLEECSLPVLEDEPTSYDFKDSLKKSSEDVLNEEILNHLEGQLDAAQEADFQNRLEKDPQLKSKVGSFRKTILTPDYKEVFANKAGLKKTEEESILEDKVIAYMENQLGLEAVNAFRLQLSKDLLLQKDLELVLKTRLAADLNITYPNKLELKKRNKLIPLFPYKVLRVAAVLALVAGIATVLTLNPGEEGKNLGNSLVSIKENKTVTHPNKKENQSGGKIEKPGQREVKQVAATFSNPATKVQQQIVKPEEESVTDPQSEIQLAETKEAEPKLPISVDSVKVEAQQATQIVKSTEELEQLGELSWMEEAEEKQESQKKGFIQRIASLAGQANKLGVRAVDGESGRDDSYRLAIFGYSVEKK